MGLEISVIVPTYERCRILMKCLGALERQTASHGCFEVVIVDDGSSDQTRAMVHDFAAVSPLQVRYFYQANKGPAAARNLGIRESNCRLLLFMGDDIIAAPEFVSEHLAWHRDHPADEYAMLGFVTWSPDIRVTPLMYWLEHGGPQFAYHEIKHGGVAGWSHFYTCNLSVKREFLLAQGLFDEEFSDAAWEDLELAYRLEKNGGLIVLFDKNAVGYHFHPTRLAQFTRRSRVAGQARRLMARKHPDIVGPPPPIKPLRQVERALLAAVSPIATVLRWRRALYAYYSLQTWAAERAGYFSGMSIRGKNLV